MQTLKVWAVSTLAGRNSDFEVIALQRGGTLEALVSRLQRDDVAWDHLKEQGRKARHLQISRGRWQTLMKKRPIVIGKQTPRVYLMPAQIAPDWAARITYCPFQKQQLSQES